MDNIIEEDIIEIKKYINFEKLFNKKILLTGGTGLIGTYLISTLISLNDVENANIKIYLVIHNELPKHLEKIKNRNDINIYKGDLSEYEFCYKLPECDFIIHAAGYAQPNKFLSQKVKTIIINTMCTSILLNKLKENGNMLFISTSEIYSGANNLPYTEKTCGLTMPDHPRACYIEGKRCGEAICFAFSEMTSKNVKIARVSLAYGPGIKKDDSRVLYNFIQKGLKGRIELVDFGEDIRVYCYVRDTVIMLYNILLNGKSKVYNVGGNSYIQIKHLAELIGSYLHADVILPQNINNKLVGAPKSVYVSCESYIKEFGEFNYIPIEIGLKRTIEWCRNEWKE